MAPNPEENLAVVNKDKEDVYEELTGDEVVITGISGSFPDSETVYEFMENLYNKKDMVSEDGYGIRQTHPELIKYLGKAKSLDKFDPQFFRVSYAQAVAMNESSKFLLEHTYRALFDAGVNPVSLYGKKVGVFVGGLYGDSFLSVFNNNHMSKFLITGYAQCMLANRISYWLNSRGPSFNLDVNYSSSIACLEMAYRSIKSGECDSAIVGAYNSCLDPRLTINLKRYGLLCSDGKTKCFDKSGDGFVRADTTAILYLQKAKDAKRIYSEVYHVNSKYFADPSKKFTHSRRREDIDTFLKEFYSQIKVSPGDVQYIEANAIGHAKYDAEELEAIGNFFGEYKKIKVGAVHSNMGYSEGASSVCSVIKTCLAYNQGVLPANLHYKEPLEIPALKDGRVQVLTEPTTLNKTVFSAINSFTYTGVNYHALLKGHYKDVINENSSIPHLVLASGRKEESVDIIFNYLETNPLNLEQIALLRGFFEHNISAHTGRGYIVIDTNHDNKTQVLSRSVAYISGQKRPVWFLYSGMGSQWNTMGEQLLKIPLFAETMEKCQRILEPMGIDVMNIITSPDKSIFENILNCFVGIAAVQIGLTDILKAIGIVPDNVIGHSLGELGCAYADNSLSAEQMLLSAYYRGLITSKTKFIKGSMAAVGLGYKNLLKICPNTIEAACHNSSTSCTISGPADDVTKFVAELNRRGIFAKEVETANIAFHSRYIKHAGPDLLKCMRKMLKKPKLRSSKWLCTSVPHDQWDDAKYASAEYFTDNLLNHVYFEETARLIPDNAIVIEIAPNGLLQAIVKRSHAQCTHVPLTNRKSKDSVLFLLNSIGKLYEAGLSPKISVLYPEVKFPITTKIPLLSHLVGFEHSETWSNYEFNSKEVVYYIGRKIIASLHDEEYKYIEGHVINGTIIFPQAAILISVWETLAMYHNEDYRNFSVTFEDIKFYSNIVITKDDSIHFKIQIQKGSHEFEVTRNHILITSGIIKSIKKSEPIFFSNIESKDVGFIDSKQIYKAMRYKGYNYTGEFQSIYSSNVNGDKAYIRRNNNWVTLLDALLQINAFARNHDGVSSAKLVNRITIDVRKYRQTNCISVAGINCYYAELSKVIGLTACAGVTIKDIVFADEANNSYSSNMSNINRTNRMLQKNLRCILPSKKYLNKHIILSSDANCGIDNLVWVVDSKDNIINRETNLVKVCYSGLSRYDCSKAVGNTSKADNTYGMDFSGTDIHGNFVMGVVNSGALSNYVTADHDLTWPVPKHWSLEDAATVPLPYLQAYYCLTIRSQLRHGSTVLVTGGAGALGQAVISLCLSLDCDVYATVSSLKKKMFLMKLFPKLNEHNIFYSRHESFSDHVLAAEKNRCDIVINCCNGKLRNAAMRCVTRFGILLDVTESDINSNESYGMYFNDEDQSYISVRLNHLFENNYIRDKKLLQQRITEGIAKGVVKPLSRVVYSSADVIRAFRLLSSSRHTGRVLINMSENASLEIVNRFCCAPSNVQLIFCGEDNFGIAFVDNLIAEGAKTICIAMNPNSMTANFRQKMNVWLDNNIDVKLISWKINSTNDDDVLEQAHELGTIEGIYILINSDMANSSAKHSLKFINSMDKSSRKLKQSRFFMILSSNIPGIKAEISGYEKICQQRNALNLHASLLLTTLSQINADYEINGSKSSDTAGNLYNNNSIQESFRDLSKGYDNRLLSILGFKELQHIDLTKTLETLELTDVNLDEIKALIKSYNNVEISRYAIEKMSLEKLALLGNDCKKNNNITGNYEGLKAFHNYFNYDECESFEPITSMVTMLNQSIQRDEDFKPEETYLLMIPGFSGEYQIFEQISERLEIKALTLKLLPDYNNDSIEAIAASLFKHLKDKITIKSNCYILGYSFGVLVALELGAILEKEGHKGIIFCLDSSPNALKEQLNAYLGKLTEDELQDEIIEHTHALITGVISKDVKQNLKKIDTWCDKKLYLISKVHEYYGLSKDYLDNCVESLYRRILLSHEYCPKYRLKSRLVLIKGVLHPEMVTLDEDFGLSRYSSEPVQVFNIELDHPRAPYDYRVSNIINKLLKPHISQEFNLKDKCNFYFWQKITS